MRLDDAGTIEPVNHQIFQFLDILHGVQFFLGNEDGHCITRDEVCDRETIIAMVLVQKSISAHVLKFNLQRFGESLPSSSGMFPLGYQRAQVASIIFFLDEIAGIGLEGSQQSAVLGMDEKYSRWTTRHGILHLYDRIHAQQNRSLVKFAENLHRYIFAI